MVITSVYDPEEYIISSMDIVKEFIYKSFEETVDVIDYNPGFNEENPVTTPTLMLQLLPGSSLELGMGRCITNGKKGVLKTVEIMASWIFSSECGNERDVKKCGQKLVRAFDKNYGMLKQLGLDQAKCGGMTEYLKGNNVLFGGTQLISFKVVSSW